MAKLQQLHPYGNQALWPVPLIHLLNTTTRIPFEVLFATLIEAIVFLFALGIQCLDENETTAKCSAICMQLR